MNFKNYFEVLLESNPVKRKEYLKNKYGKLLDQLIQSYDTDKSFYSTTFYGIFGNPIDFVVDKIDPTSGNYSEWIIKSLLAQSFTRSGFDRFWSEDFFKVREDLEKFHKYKHLFKKLGKEQDDPEISKLTDLNRIKGIYDLYEKLKLITNDIEFSENEKDVDKIYESNNYLIVVPKTKEASCAYGRNTRWCTAANSSYNAFNQYNREGPLYIVIDKANDIKTQFHFQSKQYMDEKDDPINVRRFLKENSEIKDVILNLAIQNEDINFVAFHAPEKLNGIYPDLTEKSKIELIQNNFTIAVPLIEKYKEDVNKYQNLLFITDENTVKIKTDATSFSEFIKFYKDDYRKNSRKTAEKILDGEWYDAYDTTDYSDYMLHFLDAENSKRIIEYTKKRTNEEVSDVEEAIKELKYIGEADFIIDLIEKVYNEYYNREYIDEIYNKTLKGILEFTGEKYSFQDYHIVLEWSIDKLTSLNNRLKKFLNENPYEDIRCNWRDVYSAWISELDNGNDLIDFDIDNVYINLSKETLIEMNSEISDDLEIIEKKLEEELLNSNEEKEIEERFNINKVMTQFDSYVKKIMTEGLGNMGQGGLSNRGPAVTQNNNSSSTTVNRSTTSSQANSANKNNSALDVGAYFKNQSTDWDREMKMPEFQNAVAAHYDNMMLDPKTPPQERNDLMMKIQKTPALQKYFQNRTNQQANLGGPINV